MRAVAGREFSGVPAAGRGLPSGHPRQKVERFERDRRGAVAPATAERVDHLALGRERETLDLDRRPSDIATQPLQPFAIGGLGADLGVQGEVVDERLPRRHGHGGDPPVQLREPVQSCMFFGDVLTKGRGGRDLGPGARCALVRSSPDRCESS